MKTCTRCRTPKPIESFTALNPWCRECVFVYNRQYRDKNKSRIRERKRIKWAQRGPEINNDRRKTYAENRDVADRARQKTQRWRDNNREHHRAYTRAWRAANRERALARKREYYKLNRDAAQASIRKWKSENPEALRDYWHNREALKRKVGGKHTRAEIAALFLQQRGLCAVCESDISKHRHRDHIVPISAGGSNDIGNIQLLCPDCNLAKRAKDMETFLSERVR